jgi:hypothetical protein
MPRIESYSFGHIVVDGQEATNDVIVLPSRVVHNWWRRDGHSLVLDDLRDVLDELPSRLVLGTGAYGRMHPDPQALEELRERGIEVEALPTEQAVRRYGELDAAHAAAALHLTC